MRVLGIEFGSWSVKAVEAESGFRKFNILDFHEIRLPLQMLDPTASYKDAVQHILARLPATPEKIVTSLPTSQTALRFLQIPVRQRKKVERMFRFELEDSVPFRLEDAIVEHHIARAKEGSLVLAGIAPKKHVQAHLDWVRSVGIDPDWLLFDGMGVVNLFLTSLQNVKTEPSEGDPGPIMLLDIGNQKTNLSIFHEGQVEIFRSLAWGGAAVTQAIALNLSLPLEEAENCKQNDLKLDAAPETLSGEAREMVTAAQQALSAFLADINHSLVAFRTLYGKRLGGVRLTGGTSKIWGIEGYLSAALDVPVEAFRPFSAAGSRLEEEHGKVDEARFGEALGRSLVYDRSATLLFNFRRRELAKQTSLNEVTGLLKNPNVIRLVRYAMAFAAILFLHVTVASYVTERTGKDSSEQLRKVFSETFPSVPAKQRSTLLASEKELRKFIDQKNKESEQKLKMLTKARIPMLTLLRAISEAFPAQTRVDVNRLQIDDKSFSMDGALYEGDLKAVTENLKKVTVLANIALQSEGQRFSFRGDVVGRQ